MRYNFLKGASKFPELRTVDVYKAPPFADYGEYDAPQMACHALGVPWDVGSVRVGMREIAGLGNVVHFGTAAARDAYFDGMSYASAPKGLGEWAAGERDGISWVGKSRKIPDDGYFDMPIPYELASGLNYLWIEYPTAPVEGAERFRRFYFIRELEPITPSMTRAHVLPDRWQTFIYQVEIEAVNLERGHAPMTLATPAEFLADPQAYGGGLLVEDFTAADSPSLSRHATGYSLNADTVALVICTSRLDGDFGSWQDLSAVNPGRTSFIDGHPEAYAYSCAGSDVERLLLALDVNSPQASASIEAVAFVPAQLVEAGDPFDLHGVSVRRVSGRSVTSELARLAPEHFGYPAAYANLAKLYTWPYACVELSDTEGNSTVIRVEDTTGRFSVDASLNLIAGFLAVDVMIGGVAGAGVTLSWVDAKDHARAFGADFARLAKRWELPTFSIVMNSATLNNIEHAFNDDAARNSANVDLSNANRSADAARASAYASADAALANALDSAATAKANSDRSAATAKANSDRSAEAGAQNAFNSQRGAIDADFLRRRQMLADHVIQTELQRYQSYSQIGMNNNLAEEKHAFMLATVNNEIATAQRQGALSETVSLAGSGVSMAAGVAASFLTGGASGAASVVAGATSAVSAGTQAASLTIGTNLTQEQYNEAVMTNINSTGIADVRQQEMSTSAEQTSLHNLDMGRELSEALTLTSAAVAVENAGRSRDVAEANTQATKTTSDANAQATKATSDTNAQRAASTAKGNADRVRDVALANARDTRGARLHAIEQADRQRSVMPPRRAGTTAHAEQAGTRPMGYVLSVKTQRPDEIRQAGDHFQRWGYGYNGRWTFERFDLMSYFTFWKCQDVYFKDSELPDATLDALRYLLMGGVTVWTDPTIINRVDPIANRVKGV